jgi:hypothetical protein
MSAVAPAVGRRFLAGSIGSELRRAIVRSAASASSAAPAAPQWPVLAPSLLLTASAATHWPWPAGPHARHAPRTSPSPRQATLYDSVPCLRRASVPAACPATAPAAWSGPAAPGAAGNPTASGRPAPCSLASARCGHSYPASWWSWWPVLPLADPCRQPGPPQLQRPEVG